ncbi:MAG: low molecular weight phosphotyrosine protein phosphatase [Sulfurovum sp.]|nr:low molecular weight phosphotyrosine protein phosphatase [Sulfurovum sp.]
MKKKILFVCLGNICRSPLAHGIAEKISLENNFSLEVDSAGTSNWHVGEAPCDHSITIATRHDVDISQQQSRTITKKDITHYDYVVAMDKQNKEDMEAFGFKNVHLLGDFAEYNGEDVPDPYFFTGASVLDGFEKVYSMIQLCVKDFIIKGKNGSL